MKKGAKFNPLRFLRVKAERRELSPDLDDVLASALLRGDRITEATARGVPALYAGVSFIAGMVSMLPVRLRSMLALAAGAASAGSAQHTAMHSASRRAANRLFLFCFMAAHSSSSCFRLRTSSRAAAAASAPPSTPKGTVPMPPVDGSS